MNSETKFFLGIILATAVIIGGAIFFFSRPTNAPLVDPKVLVSEDSHKIGSPSATVTMVEFGDFQCPACGAYHAVVKQLLGKYSDSLALVFRHFPLPSHPNALPASRAVEAAGIQGKFWEMYDKVYESQKDWSAEKNAGEIFVGYAKTLGLNTNQFAKDMASSGVQKRIDADVQDANTLGINATPTFFLNGEKIQNPASFEDFETMVKALILKTAKPSISAEETYHIHANIKVIVDGQAIDFTQKKYQSEEGKELNDFIHFHDGKGDMFHIHKKGMLLQDLFGSFGMTFTGKPFALYVNGILNSQYESYQPQDLDRIFITSGSITEEARQSYIASVSDDACIYSEKCPERGTPPTEECVGGLGTDCK